jgi:hypothetical protein
LSLLGSYLYKQSRFKKIAKDGHVYSFKKSIQELDKNNGVFSVEKIGINNASVFNGFCSKHDKELFLDIEDKQIIFSDKQILLLAYRAIANELYLKYSSLNYNSKLSMHKLEIPMEIIGDYINYINLREEAIKLVIRDLEYIKKCYDSSLINNDILKYNEILHFNFR